MEYFQIFVNPHLFLYLSRNITYYWSFNVYSYLNIKEINETATTNRSRRLNPALQKAPGCKMNPYEMTFRQTSIVNMVVKK